MKKNKYWSLNVSTFTFWDKLKIFWWLCTEKIWTAGEWVRRYEKIWEDYTNCPHVIAVSSGSAANELIALRRKWELEKEGSWPKKNKVIFAANTWISNVSPWLNIGFEPIFVDAKTLNLNVSIEDLRDALIKNKNVGTVFYTTLLGYSDDLLELKKTATKYNAKFLLDNCESSFSWQRTAINYGDFGLDESHISYNNLVTCSTSCYFSHFTTSGTELGLIFTHHDEEADWYRMARNHGMTRGMPEKYWNKNVDRAFDFYLMGSNYRTSNLACYMASLDFERALKFSEEKRIRISNEFYHNLDLNKFEWPQYENTLYENNKMIPLALPIIVSKRANRPDLINKIKDYLISKGVETRPVVGGFLGAHTTFKKYNLNPKNFPRSIWIHNNGIYIGLHHKITLKMARKLAKEISNL